MNCIITGGSGFIGTHLINDLLSDPEVGLVCVVDLKPPAFDHPRLIYKQCDIREPITLEFEEAFDICFHLAAICKEPGFDWDEYFATNHVGTLNVCDFLSRIRVPLVVFTSTMMVFRAGESKNDERSLASPDTAYGISKLLAEGELLRWRDQQIGRKLKIVRPGVVFGKGERGNFTRMYRALRRGVFAYIGRKSTIKGCVYVKDVVRCLRFLVTDHAQQITYNLVLPEVTTTEYICHNFCDVFGFRSYIPTLPYRLAYYLSFVGEALDKVGVHTGIHHRRIQKLFFSTDLCVEALRDAGFEFRFSLRDALSDWRDECLPEDIH